MSAYAAVADLPVVVDSIEYRRHSRETTSGFTRVSTEVHLSGSGHHGRGEDVTYEADAHDSFADWLDAGADGLLDALSGEQTLDEVCSVLASRNLVPDGPWRSHTPRYRRWAFESATLDLALRQQGVALGDRLARTYRPIRFVASTRLSADGTPSLAPVSRLRGSVPGLEFKLDPTAEWTPELIRALADTEAVRILDFKGFYEGTAVDGVRDPAFYRSLIDAFPDAIIEDPAVEPQTRPILEPIVERLSWDYPITDADALSDQVEAIGGAYCNVKPSRIGSLEALFGVIEYADDHDITLYGGGQFELGVGRGQIQAIASLFYPDGPNDVAPGVYNDPNADESLPAPPIQPSAERTPGFGIGNGE